MQIYPDNLNHLELNKHEKIFLNTIKSKLPDDVLSFVGINPTGIDNNVLNLFITTEGLVFIKVLDLDSSNGFNLLFETWLKKLIDNSIDILKAKLLNHRFLRTDKDTLKFPFNYVLYVPILEGDMLHFDENYKKKHFLFKDSKSNFKEDAVVALSTIIHNCPVQYTDMNGLNDENIRNLIIQRLAPEYTIPKMGIVENESHRLSTCKDEDYIINESDKVVQAYLLDSLQINLVNNLKKGEQLILACAGSGKSVLLISKCFKIASINKDRKFLITCFNSNLKNYYEWQINVAGFREKNVSCQTFHALCKTLLNKYNIHYSKDDHDGIVNKAIDALKRNIIKDRFHGIFIDEVQIFKPEWYKFCFNLLESKNTDDHVFVICGDISQNINNNIKRGKAPWQGDDTLPKFRGKTIRIEKNYRNTIEINDFVNFFVDSCKKHLDELDVEFENKEDLFLRGKSVRHGNIPELYNRKITNNIQEASEVLRAIKKMHDEKEIAYTDIAVLMYNRSHKKRLEGWDDYPYMIQVPIVRLLEKNNIPYSNLVDSDIAHKEHYANRQGVTLITCESALGLDFRGVVLCGLKPMGAYYNSKDEHNLYSDCIEIDKVKEEFIRNINTLYTACTRAKDELIIVISEPASKSIYSRLLGKAMLNTTNKFIKNGQ